MIYGSVCSGIEAASVAWQPLGWKAKFFSEIESFPSKILAHHYPDVPNLGDLTKFKEWNINEHSVDLIVGGTPCFVAGTKVLTPKGYVAIETLKVGDKVIAGNGTVQHVEVIGNKLATVGELRVGGRYGIQCTPNHSWHCLKVKRDNSRKSETLGRKIPDGDYTKTRADEAVGKMVARPAFKHIARYKVPSIYNATKQDVIELAGWYVGDGYIKRAKDRPNTKAVVLALINKNKINKFVKRFTGKINFTVNKDGKVVISNSALANWLVDNFSELSHNKRIPYWLYKSKYKQDFLEGYITTDGSKKENSYFFVTVSEALALGLADLFEKANVSFVKTEDTKYVKGKVVNQRDYYKVSVFTTDTPKTKFLNGHYCSVVRSYTHNANESVRVYNIQVSNEHTYVVNGLYTYNCQAFSVAGLRKGMDDERGNLSLEFVRLLDRVKPRWVVWENVPGVLSSNGGRDFSSFITALHDIGYGFCWRILDASCFGVPQKRRRVFLVGYYGDARPAAAVLFERQSLRGDIPAGAKKRVGVARCLTTRYQRQDGAQETYVVERVFENHMADARYKEVTGHAPTVTARYGTGGNNVPLVTYSIAENIIGRQDHNGSNGKGIKADESYTLNATGVHGITDLKGIRRLTPRECERLQGFPDDYTNILVNNRVPGDAPRYKAIGNSMAVPVMRWIGQRIEYVDSIVSVI